MNIFRCIFVLLPNVIFSLNFTTSANDVFCVCGYFSLHLSCIGMCAIFGLLEAIATELNKIQFSFYFRFLFRFLSRSLSLTPYGISLCQLKINFHFNAKRNDCREAFVEHFLPSAIQLYCVFCNCDIYNVQNKPLRLSNKHITTENNHLPDEGKS